MQQIQWEIIILKIPQDLHTHILIKLRTSFKDHSNIYGLLKVFEMCVGAVVL